MDIVFPIVDAVFEKIQNLGNMGLTEQPLATLQSRDVFEGPYGDVRDTKP